MDAINYEGIAHFLFGLLDDIDTAADIAKGDHRLYREMVERIHRRRFEVASTDGYAVTFGASGDLRKPAVAANSSSTP